MTEPPDRSPRVGPWIEKAEHDRRTAEHTLTLIDDCPFDTVCFHAQQCAEKYLKALLVSTGVNFPKTHDLVLLLNLLPAGAVALTPADVSALNRYSIEARYPGEWMSFTRQEAQDALGLAQKVRQAVRAVLNLPDSGGSENA